MELKQINDWSVKSTLLEHFYMKYLNLIQRISQNCYCNMLGFISLYILFFKIKINKVSMFLLDLISGLS